MDDVLCDCSEQIGLGALRELRRGLPPRSSSCEGVSWEFLGHDQVGIHFCRSHQMHLLHGHALGTEAKWKGPPWVPG